jgi:ribonuclease ZC3H12
LCTLSSVFGGGEVGGGALPSSGLRPIVIDASNVAMAHGRSSVFSVKGIQLVIDFFRARGHAKIVAFLPEFRKRAKMSTDPVIFYVLFKYLYKKSARYYTCGKVR